MLGQLVPCGGGPPIPLHKPKLLVGRQSFCDLPIRFPSVSSRHCELELRDGYWFVRDLGSSNGTKVNGKPCAAERLMPDDILSLAQYRFRVVYEAPEDRPPPRPVAPVVGARITPSPPANHPPPRPAERPGAAPPAAAAAGSGPPLGELVPCGGGDPIPLHKTKLIVGRRPDCDVVIRSSIVSGHHCELEWAHGSWLVRDLGSHNGIRVDGVRCEAQTLKPGQILSIANHRYQLVVPPSGPTANRPQGLFSQGLLEKAGLSRWQPPAPHGRQRTGEDDEDERPRYNLDDPG